MTEKPKPVNAIHPAPILRSGCAEERLRVEGSNLVVSRVAPAGNASNRAVP